MRLGSIRSDFHIHTYASDGAKNCTPATIVKVAEGLGLKEIGFTDHAFASSGKGCPYEKGRWVDSYFKVCNEIRGINSSLSLYVSWEVDYFDGATYSFDPNKHLESLDYVLLGFHFYEHVKGRSLQVLADYLIRIYREMAREPYANVIAHPFYVGGSPENHGAILALISDTQFAEVFHAIKANGKAAEVTTYQFSADYRNVEQSKRMYAAAKETGVKFVLNSDAHTLAEVGDGLRSYHVLCELGFTDGDFVDFAGLMALKNAG